MGRKEYDGLIVKFIPTDGMNIMTASACEEISTQYYVTNIPGQCDSLEETGNPGIGYSLNWNRIPTGWPGGNH